MEGGVTLATESSFLVRLRTKLFEHRGLLVTFMGTFCFASQSILVKLLKDEVPVIELICLRFSIQGFCSFVYGLGSGMQFRIQSKREALLLLGRVSGGLVTMLLLYYAMFNMSVAMAVSIVFGAPVFVGIFAWVILKEPFLWRDIILVALNLAGVVLIAQPPFLFRSERLDSAKKTELLAVVAAVSAMLLAALTFIFIRLLGLINCSVSKMVFYFSVIGTVVPAIAGLAMQNWVVPTCGRPRYFILLIGILNFVYVSFVSYGLTTAKKSYFVSIVNSSQIPLTIILEIFILHEIPNWISLLGAGFVIGSALGVVFREGALAKTKTMNSEQQEDERVQEEEDVNEQFRLQTDTRGECSTGEQ